MSEKHSNGTDSGVLGAAFLGFLLLLVAAAVAISAWAMSAS
jgi:hypothetical protein